MIAQATNVIIPGIVKRIEFHNARNPSSSPRNEKINNPSCSPKTGNAKATIKIKKKFGKNAILKGMDLQEGATTKERNEQIGGHKK